MKPYLKFAGAILSQWVTYVTGGVLVALNFVLASLSVQTPAWMNLLIIISGLVVAAYRVWLVQHDRAIALRHQIVPRLQIRCVPVFAPPRYRIEVRNLSRTTVRFAARLESIEPAIDHGLPVHLQITHHAEPQAEIPAHGVALVDVFIDYPYGRQDCDLNMHDEIGLLLSGHPATEYFVQRQRYTIRICAYPVGANEGIPAERSFYIIPRFQQWCVFGDAGVPYQEPV
jgi:hypothetical protein